MSETIIHRHGEDATPITVYGTVEEVQAALDRPRENETQFAEFTTTNRSTVEYLEAVT